MNIKWPGSDLNAFAKNLIIKILKQNPKERPSLDEILSQPWFEKYPPIYPVMSPSKINYEEISKIIQKKGKTISIMGFLKKLIMQVL